MPSLFADDEFYSALASRTRRRALAYLLERGEFTVDELSEALCGWEAAPGEPVSSDRYREHRIVLDHKHLPRLVDAGLVTYDRSDGRVAPTDLDERIGDLVRLSLEAERGPSTG